MCILLPLALYAEVPVVHPDLSQPTGIAPAFFGPNAFPVPDMLDGRTQENLRVELAADGYFGFKKDQTADLFGRIYIPLGTPRVNLTVWMPFVEWYRTDSLSGHETGDVYVSTDIQILKAYKYTPDIAFRAAFKTASGGSFEKYRFYDNCGYWFDLAVGKSLYVKSFELRLAGSLGFLCWQTDNGRQNDALMYGVQLLAKHECVSLRATWGGYMGWEKYGDRPMTVKVQVAGHVKGFEPYIAYQYGIKDYPFHQLRVGLVYNLDILKGKGDWGNGKW